MLTIQNLKKSFAQHHVLTGINLTIKSGSITAIIGPNGCGKSTFFNLITADLTADSGSVTLDGVELTKLPPHQIARLGMIRKFQIPGVFPDMTVIQHLTLPFSIRHQKTDHKLIQKTAKIMNISKLLNHPVRFLSTGQKQWLELAMLVLLKPKVLLLDEPIAGMTASEIETTLLLLKELNEAGLTIVTIEHNMDFVQKLTQDIIVFMNGCVHLRSDFNTIANNKFIKEHYLGSLYA